MTYDNSTYFLLFTPLVPSFVVQYRTTTASYYEETPYVVLVTTQNPKTIKWWIWFRLRRRLLSRSSQTHKEEEKQREEIRLLVWAFLVGKRRNSIDFSAPSVVANESNNLSQRSACKHIVMMSYKLKLKCNQCMWGNSQTTTLGQLSLLWSGNKLVSKYINRHHWIWRLCLSN